MTCLDIKKIQKIFWLSFLVLPYLSIFSVSSWNLYEKYAIFLELVLIITYLIFNKTRTAFVFFIITYCAYLLFVFYSNDKCGIGSIVTSILSIMIIEYMSQVNFNKPIIAFIYRLSVLMIISLCFFAWFIRNHYTLVYNTNTLGMLIMFAIMNYFCFKKEKILSLFDICCILLSLYAMILLRARGVILATVCFFIMCYCHRVFTPKIMMLSVLLIVAGGVIFPISYLEFVKKSPNTIILGKQVASGRQALWKDMFEKYALSDKNKMLGLGSKTKLDELDQNTSNVHNYHLALIFNFGILGYIIYYSYMLSVMSKVIKVAFSFTRNWRVQRSVFMFVSSVWILGYTEMSGVWAPLFVFSYLGLAVGYSEYRKHRIEYRRESKYCYGTL